MTAIDEQALRQEFIQEFGLEKLEQSDQDQIIVQMTEVLLKRIFVDTMEKLGEAGVTEYEALLERASGPEDIEQFLEAKIPGYNVFVREIVDDFKHHMKQDILN